MSRAAQKQMSLVPKSQLWIYSEPAASKIQRGLTWIAEHPPAETNLDALLNKANARKKRK